MSLEPTDSVDYQLTCERIRAELDELQVTHAEQLPMWTVFGPGTRDHPGLCVARLWLLYPEPRMTEVLLRAASLAELRALLPDSLTCMPRQAGDDPNIIETWI